MSDVLRVSYLIVLLFKRKSQFVKRFQMFRQEESGQGD